MCENEKGCIFKSLSRFSHLMRSILKRVYHFENWHWYSYQDKPYAQDIVTYCNGTKNKNSVIEIGCGLGDITRRLKFKKKIGWDISPEVLRAARLLSLLGSSNVKFEVSNFMQKNPEGTFNVIIYVN